MHRNYFIFERQVSEVHNMIKECVLQKCFTYRKDELILQFSGKKRHFLRIGLNLQTPYLLLTPFQNIKDPQTTFFESIRDQPLRKIYILPYDKRVILDFGGNRLQAIFYGKHPNVILQDADGRALVSFKKKLGDTSAGGDLPVLLPGELNAGNFSDAIKKQNALHLQRFLGHALAGFNNLLATEICHRCKIQPDMTVQRLNDFQIEAIVKTVQKMLAEFKTYAPTIYHETSGNVVLTICRLNHLNEINKTESFSNLNEAWERFFYLSEIVRRYERQYQKAFNALKKRLDYLHRTRRQLKSAQDLAERKAEATLKGNLLQTFAMEIRKGQSTVSLPNIFLNDAEKVKIKLNPAKSAYENAKIYFEKYKDSEVRDTQLKIKIDTIDQELSEIQGVVAQLEGKPSPRKLEKIIQDLQYRHLIQPEDNVKKSDTTFIYSFNRLLLEKKWEVLIGKNAANNDLLTFKFSRKFDLWFHAQSVSGSHVVIRLPNRNEHPPQSVIQDVACIAAYHSTARHSGSVPVNYTEVRYVRKPRKALPGQVLISNEKTLFVIPKKLG